MMERHFLMNPLLHSTMEDKDKDEGVEGALVNSNAGTSQLNCISEAVSDDPGLPYL